MLIMLILVTGCGKKEEGNSNNNSVSGEGIQSSEPATEPTIEATDEKTTKTTTTTKKTTKTTTTTKKTTTTTKEASKSYGKNMYKSVKSGKINKYTYTYADEATCKKRGDDHFDEINPTHPYVVFGCEEVKDENGKSLWGVFYYKTADEKSIFYY